MTTKNTYDLEDLLTLMAHLREPVYGCPWDKVQTYETIAASTIEEAYEVVDAIEQGDALQLKEELGDLLFQVVFYSQLGKEDKCFTFADIVSSITAKLIHRHPHVFPNGSLEGHAGVQTDTQARSQQDINTSWEQIKQKERKAKGYDSILDDVPSTFPAMTRASKLQKRASSVGFDWQQVNEVLPKLDEEIDELKQEIAIGSAAIEEELGDVFFTLINLSRHLKIDPETALRKANTKFEQRFRYMESQLLDDPSQLSQQTVDQLESLWRSAKSALANK